eukprot:TRINITY_DN2280_c2_g1_i1.p1 TRINITY_DN2280_c2_g1~~TRINITY_DN2280_c2_g1_i1.p1  ORF type:complete len:516 (+),score=283.55 TRINITY_DN2280_c2_g1_i1:105-1652(+)
MAASDTQIMERRLRLMQEDRKANFETTNMSIKQNSELVKSLRKENKELSQALTRLAKDGSAGASATAFQTRELQTLDHKINVKRRQLDEVRATHEKFSKQLKALESVEVDLMSESQPVYRDGSPLDLKIRLLEQRLDKSMIKYNEATSIRRTYEQIVRRLKDERIGFDNQLAAIERTLRAKDHDYQELLNMSHDAAHAKDIARAELAQFKAAYEEEKRQKDLELAERKRHVQTRLDHTKALEKREKQRRAEEEAALRKQEEERERERGLRATSDVKTVEEREREEEYEKHFKRIKDATGVTKEDEGAAVAAVIDKFLRQEETHKSLVEMTKGAQQKIEELRAEKKELHTKVEELKYSGSGQLGSRRIVDEFETHLTEARHQCEKNRQKYERVAKILISVKAGIEHLAEKLSTYKPESLPPQMTDENVVDVLRHSEQKLQLLMEEALPTEALEQPTDTQEIELPPHNRRIKIPSEMEAEEEVEEDDDEEVDDLMDRDTVKKLATMAVQREHKKSKE